MSMNERHAEAARLRATGMTYEEIAGRLGYANRDGARRAVLSTQRKPTEMEGQIYQCPPVSSVILSRICPRCRSSAIVSNYGEVLCLLCAYRPGEDKAMLWEKGNNGKPRMLGRG